MLQAKASPVEKISDAAIKLAGSTWGFSAALLVVIGRVAAGPFFGFSEGWELVINSCTTIITFLMVFLIQLAQNKDIQALQVKLDEVLGHTRGADGKLIKIDEESSEKQLEKVRGAYRKDKGRPRARRHNQKFHRLVRAIRNIKPPA